MSHRLPGSLPALLLSLLLGLALVAGCTASDPQSPGTGEPTESAPAGDQPSDEATGGGSSPGKRKSDATGPPGPPSTDGTLSRPAYGRGSKPPRWLFERVLPETEDGFGEVRPTPRVLQRRAFTLPDVTRALPGRGYVSRIRSPAPREVVRRSTWTPGCPVARDELAWLRLTFWGFDARRHTGELLVHAAVVSDIDQVFHRLWQARFPMEQVLIVRSIDEEAPPTGDGNGTGGFVCRAITGGTSFSQHAYGLAVDVNTFQNPYQNDDVVLPELASAYLDRNRVRPGMVTPDGPVVAAFREIGWLWGGAWSGLKDYQHFSANGR